MIQGPRQTLLAVVALVAVVALLVAALALLTRPVNRIPPPVVLEVTFDSERLTGEPGQNTSEIWIARVTSVTWNLSTDSYEVRLVVNGSVAIERTGLHPGELGRAGPVLFEFFEEGAGCFPTPCPPPEGPDGNLSRGDYFRLSSVSADTEYTIQVLRAEGGALAGEMVIRT